MYVQQGSWTRASLRPSMLPRPWGLLQPRGATELEGPLGLKNDFGAESPSRSPEKGFALEVLSNVLRYFLL